MLDIFNNSAFSVVSLTDAINRIKFVPGRLGQMGIFRERGITGLTAAIEMKDGNLVLVPPTPRGGPGITVAKGERSMVAIAVPHFEINDAINADEVQGVRAFGEEEQLETVQGMVAERGAQHSQSLAATTEANRVGAIKGVITYADGVTLNLFTQFNVTQLAEIDFDLDNAGATDGALRAKCAQVVRAIAEELDGMAWAGKVRALVGDTFFDQLLSHPEVRATYKGWTQAAILREGYVEANGLTYGAFEFGGIIWENYRGAVGGTAFVAATKAHFFPEGVPGLFSTIWSPADYIETVNTMGKRLYVKQYPFPNDKGIHFDVQMNELNYCTRPRVLLKGKNT